MHHLTQPRSYLDYIFVRMYLPPLDSRCPPQEPKPRATHPFTPTPNPAGRPQAFGQHMRPAR